MKLERHHITAILVILFAGAACFAAGNEFAQMLKKDVIRPAEGISKIAKLSKYCEGLVGTRADADVYFFEGEKPGATVMLLGGTHPNEPAGFIAGVLMIENAAVREGRLIVLPQACNSGFTCTDPLEGVPEKFTIAGRNGMREFRFGARAANPLDQWPDPLVFLQYPSDQQLSGNETRNLNRAYPGRADGTPTEKAAYAIMEIIRRESVDVAFDLHEAAPEIPIINAIVAHQKSRDIAAAAVLNLEFNGLQYSLELSPDNFHGLSHREWGERTNVLPFLMETSNPIQGRLRGVTSSDLIVNGNDYRYWQAAQLGKMRITYELDGEPLSLRVARHLEGFKEILNAYNEVYPEKKITIDHLPDYGDLIKSGVGNYLR